MSQLIKNAQRILKESDVISFPRYWSPKGEVVRNGKKATVFNRVEPSRGQRYIIAEEGNLYVYGDGDIEFVILANEGKEYSVSLIQIKEAKKLFDEVHMMPWGFSGLEISEEGKILFEFMDEDSMLYRPRVLVDVENKRTEYFPDGEPDDSMPF
ncbi:MAG: hypothetical protein HY506_02520 [Candidatus Yanofskybacteria bacterium]|nr:hypothetical protein [Candidatus Yanofskybacteria bacterium]